MGETRKLADIINKLASLKEEFVDLYATTKSFGSKRYDAVATALYVSLGELADSLKRVMEAEDVEGKG